MNYFEVMIDLDGACGYPTGWLSEAFRHVPREAASRITFKSDEDPSLINEIYEILEEGDDE